jgi:hypothetical protein
LLIWTPIAGLIGLVVLLAAMYLLAGGEIRSWRSLLRRRPRAGGADGSGTISGDDELPGPGPDPQI